MMSVYEKSFTFRDCFDEKQVQGEIAAINEIFRTANQKFKDTWISNGTLTAGPIDRIVADMNLEFEELCLNFWFGNSLIAYTCFDHCKEIKLSFEITENLITNELVIDDCKIKMFEEYQI